MSWSRRIAVIALVLAILAAPLPALANFLMIDDFTSKNSNDWPVNIPGQAGTANLEQVVDESGLGDVVGGTRKSYVDSMPDYVNNRTGGVSADIDTVRDGGQGYLDLAGSGWGMPDLTLQYAAGGAGLGLDLTPYSYFTVSFILNSLGVEPVLGVVLSLSDGAQGFAIGYTPSSLVLGHRYTMKWNMSDFAGLDPAFDMHNIQSLWLQMSGDPGMSLSLDYISAQTPEPATLLLFLSGAMATGIIRRRARSGRKAS